MQKQYLYQEYDTVSQMNMLPKEIPVFVKENLNPDFELRAYQIEAFARFFHYYNNYPNKQIPIHLLFNMATGSGKTLIMAWLILYLYEKWYRNFLFFVNSNNIIEKTKDNFLNTLSSKFLFNQKIFFDNQEVKIIPVENFEWTNNDNINICFTTIQKLHSDLYNEKENSLTLEDFKDKKIVLLADEAHHNNAKTKAKKGQAQLIEEPSFENTVEKVLNSNLENILLEFTATLAFWNKDIEDKYLNKILYKYDLLHFRQDGFSKDVNILQAELEEKERIIQAIVLNQYRQDIAWKYGINLKPVILFKAQKTIAESLENKAKFHQIIENLSIKELEQLKGKATTPIMKKVFDFYDHHFDSLELLVQKLKVNFAENKCISVNEEAEKENNQILINSLEDKNNQIRCVFAVNKLNEGWDVLNLFDIVRLYKSRTVVDGKPWPQTIAEAQLIGRGARYCPFVIDPTQNKYKRKYDEDLENELRILEELHYHCLAEPLYITELKSALKDQWLLDDDLENKELKLKESFKKTSFFKSGIIYLNNQEKNTYDNVKSFADMNVKKKNFEYNILSSISKESAILKDIDSKEKSEIQNKESKVIALPEIPKHIIRKALAKNVFYKFNTLQTYFPKLASIDEFINSTEFLWWLEITFWWLERDLSSISNKNYLYAIMWLLTEIEKEIKWNLTDYIWTKEFKPHLISQKFFDKVLRLNKKDERYNWQEDFIEDKDWYVFNANYWTSEEKAFVKMFSTQIEEFKTQYDEIFLIRNEKHFKIFNFQDWQAFEPDFVLFLHNKKTEKNLTYQIFIEPKWSHLIWKDQWKQDFLKEIKEEFKDKIITFNETKKYKITWVPFYNLAEENLFKKTLYENIQ